MEQRLYPIGIQTFEEIRRLNNVYVDKSAYVYHMTHTSGKFFFLSRPRRFGKSLLVSTFQSYFEGRKDLFEGLAIAQLEKDWESYPVLHFDMSGGKHMEREQLERYLSYLLDEQEEKFGCKSGLADSNLRLDNLIKTAYNQTGKQVVVLIDEYDAPLLDVVHEEQNLGVLRNVMRNFYSPLKKCEQMLRFVFITGITKFSQLSIFSELNNIKNISLDENYAGICGITKEELITQMTDSVDMLAEKMNVSREATMQLLKAQYDGYHFTWPSPDVFNPFSLLNCFSDCKLGAYWFSSGTPTYLIEMMRKFNFSVTSLGKEICVGSDDFDAPTETMTTITPLLYQSGYITIKGYDKETNLYTLALPNREVSVGMYRSLLPHYLEKDTAMGKTAIARMSVILKRGDIDGALQLLADFLETVPYCDNTNYEGHYQQMFYIMFALLTDYRITVEQHTAKGRIDITLETNDSIYVMELKFNQTAQEALNQINAKRYAEQFKLSGKRIVKVGLNFSFKNEVNTLQWIAE